MAFLSSLNIPLSGMTAERFRMDIISQNVANADIVATTPEEAYKRQMVVFGEDKSFNSILRTKLGTGETKFHKYIQYKGVEAVRVVEDETPAEPVYSPNHPLADEYGYVYESNVDVATEQLDAIEAANMFSANQAVFEVVTSMAQKALNIGKG
ncbi:MAG: flagellar basal body rod protein FlgC [Oscillospiraceae bacterium]|nr:flagellar basal body rod protein FlgC [Oscillospiraceae bacterium]